MKEKIKNANMKRLIKGFTLFMGAALVVMITVVNVSFGREFDPVRFACDSLIMTGIMVFGLVMGESIGGDYGKEKPGGAYQIAMDDYLEARKAMERSDAYLPQYYGAYKEKELRNAKLDMLLDAGIDRGWGEAILSHVGGEDIERLSRETVRYPDGTIVKRLSPLQCEAVSHLFDGTVDFHDEGYAYYLQADAKKEYSSMLAMPHHIERERKINKRLGRSLKIISSLAVSLIMSTLTVNDFMDASDATAWTNLVTRLTAIATSMAAGWATATIDVKLIVGTLDNKTAFLKMYKADLDSGSFRPKTYEEEAREAYERETAPAEIPGAEEGAGPEGDA